MELAKKILQDNTASLFLFFLLAVYVLFSIAGYVRGVQSIEEANSRHAARMSEFYVEPGKTQSKVDHKKFDSEVVTKAESGIYLERISEISIADAYWVADFYIWFRWQTHCIDKPATVNKQPTKCVDPGSNFHVVDGEILENDRVKYYKEDGEEYALHRVKAKITKFFGISRFPRDDHLLVIQIEDNSYQIDKLHYIPDTVGTSVSSRVKIEGYERYRPPELIRKPHKYKTRRGDPHANEEADATYSQLVLGIWIKRQDWGTYFKLYQGLFASVAVGMLAFLIDPKSTTRVSLGVGAFFASVAATYVTNRHLPISGVMTLSDVISALGMMTIFLTILHSIMSFHLSQATDTVEEKHKVSKLDRYGLTIVFCGYVLANAVLALAASR